MSSPYDMIGPADHLEELVAEQAREVERLRIERMRFYMAAKACLADVSASDLHAIVVEMEADFKAALKEARATYEQHHTPTFCKAAKQDIALLLHALRSMHRPEFSDPTRELRRILKISQDAIAALTGGK